MEICDLLTDARAMAGVLQWGLPGFRDGLGRIEHCSLLQSRCRISRPIREHGAPYLGACYELVVRDARTGAAGLQALYAKAYSRGASLDAFREADAARGVAPRVGEPVMHLPECDVVVWSLPNDPAIAQLPAFLDAEAVRAYLPASLDPDPGALRVDAVQIVRLEPEEHCTARFALRHGARRCAVYGKSYRGDEWRDARDCAVALWQQGCADPRAFVVGRPLGSSPRLHAVWQREVAGVPLAARLAGPAGEAALDALAGALSRLHDAGPLPRETEPFDGMLDAARKWRKKLAAAEPGVATLVDRVVALLEAYAPMQPQRRRPLHGDFHVDQMLWCDGRIALFDYDDFTLGAPARDVADFVSQLLWRDDGLADWRTIAMRFVARYRAENGGAPGDAELDWYLRLMLLRKAYSFFVRHRAGWRERVRRALVDALAGLAALNASHAEARQ